MKFNLTNNEPFEVIRTADDKNVDILNLKTSDLTNDSGFIERALYKGSCSSTAAAMPKVCTVDTFPTETVTINSQQVTRPLDGTTIVVKFSVSDTNTTAAPSLDVNGTGSVGIYYNTGKVTSTAKNTTIAGTANVWTYYIYDKSSDLWVYLGHSLDSNTTYTAMTQSHIDAGTATGQCTITPKLLRDNFYTETETNNLLADKANTENLADVAFSGSYNDLEDKPTIQDVNVSQTAINSAQQNTAFPLLLANGATPTTGGALYSSKITFTNNELDGLKIEGSVDETDNKTNYMTINGDSIFFGHGQTGTGQLTASTFNGRATGTEIALRSANDALTDGASMLGYYDDDNNVSTTVHDALYDLQSFKNDIGDVLIVTLSYDERVGITSSHTYAQISTAYQSGKNIFGKMDSASTWGQDFEDFKGHMLLGGFTDQDTVFNFSTCVASTSVTRLLTFYLDSRHDWAYTISDLATLNSPTFTGTPKAPTASATTNNTQIATTAFVNTAVNNLAKTATLSNYSLYTGGIVSIWFQYDVPSSATLNINSKGAKQIRLRTTSSTSAQITAGVIKAGDTVTFVYDGQYYQLISINSYTSDRLRYKLINSTNIASTTGLTNMEPDCVYVVGSGTTETIPIWTAISSMKIASLKTTGYGVAIVDKGTDIFDTCPFDGSFVPTYQIMFRASTSFSSIELPSSVRWKDNYAPDPNDIKDNYCELTIMNNIATMNIV